MFQKKFKNLSAAKIPWQRYNTRTQANDSIMCEYFCIGIIDFIVKVKSLLDYTNLFSFNEYEKNDKIILKYFQ